MPHLANKKPVVNGHFYIFVEGNRRLNAYFTYEGGQVYKRFFHRPLYLLSLPAIDWYTRGFPDSIIYSVWLQANNQIYELGMIILSMVVVKANMQLIFGALNEARLNS